MKARRWAPLLLLLVPACAAVLDIKDLIPGAADGGDEIDGSTAEGGGPGPKPDANGPDATPDAPIDCGDTTASDENCGRCGHSCLGGKCQASACQAVAIANGAGTVTGIALDTDYVYFASFSNTISRVAKAGGATMPIAASPDVDVVKHIAVNATHVYWGNADCCGTFVARCPTAGCAGGKLEKLANVSEPIGIALDATHVYWADRNGQLIERAQLDGGARQLVGIPSSALPMSVAVADGYAFWVNDFSGQAQRSNNPPDGGAISIGANGQSGREIAVDATHVYWTAQVDTGDPGRINRAPRDGKGPVSLVGPAGGEPLGLAVDGTRVYWTAQNTLADGGAAGGVYACALSECVGAPIVIAANQDLPRGIAVDDKAIYWGNKGFVMKLAKP